MITLIDYGVGNLNAFMNVYKRLGIPVNIARSPEDVKRAVKLILPGVGSFDHAMTRLNNSGMRDTLDEMVLEHKVPVLGICVGMQMMANGSEEGRLEGLKWIDASVRRFDESKIHFKTRLPHMGWNDVSPAKESILFNGLANDSIFYFLHTYYFDCHEAEDVLARSNYGVQFSSAANRNNIFGVQFHPEKSHHAGETLLHNFAKL